MQTIKKKKITKKELLEYVHLHDRICEHCDGCRPNGRCAFAEGYKRGQAELRQLLKEVIGTE